MARTAPVPNIPAIPGMCPGIAVLAGGAGSGGGSGKGAGTGGGGVGADGQGGAGQTSGDGRAAADACTREGDPVDVATGAVVHQNVDFELTGVWSFIWRRTYLSSRSVRNDAQLGHGWSHPYSQRLEVRRRRVLYIDHCGTEHVFPQVAPNTEYYQAFGRRLRNNGDGTYSLYTRDDGLLRDFVPSQSDNQVFVLRRARDERGNAVEVHHDEHDRITHFVDTVGRKIRVRYGENGCIIALDVARATSRTAWVSMVRYDYSDQRDLIAVIDPEGHAQHYGYDNHLLRSWTNRVAYTVYFLYDTSTKDARCIETWGQPDHGTDPAIAPGLPGIINTPDGGSKPVRGIHHRILAYDDDLTEAYDPRGAMARYVTNDLGVADQVVRPSGGVVSRTFDAKGNCTSLLNGVEALWQWEYDGVGRKVSETDPLGRVIHFRYAEHWMPTEIESPNGAVWRFAHNQFGDRIRSEGPYGEVTDYTFDERGLVVEIKRDGQTVTTSKRGWHAQSEVYRDTRGETQFEYDYWGRVVRVRTNGGAEVRYVYDDRGDLVSLTDPEGHTTRYEYDGESQLITVYGADGSVRRARYNGPGWLYEVTDARGLTKKLLYDYEGEIVQVNNERGESSAFDYDFDGQVVTERTFDGRTIDYLYDGAGQCIHTDADGEITTCTYDLAGNLLSIEHPDGTTTSYSYDELDFIVKATSPEVVTELERDLCGRVLCERTTCGGRSFEVDSTYHPRGYRLSRQVLGDKLEFERDDAGHVKATVYDGVRRQELHHDTMGRLIGFSYPSGLEAEFQWDGSGRLTHQSFTRPKGSRVIDEGLTEMAGRESFIERSYEYSPMRELATVHDVLSGQATKYDYDPYGQLTVRTTSQGQDRFWYDRTGNMGRDGQQAHRGPGDRLQSLGDIELSYDDGGRVVRRVEKSTSGPRTWGYGWGGNNELLKVELPEGGSVKYAYDGFGRRVRKTLSSGEEIFFMWDANSLAGEIRRDPAGVEQQLTYVWQEANPFICLAQKADGKWYDVVTTPNGTPTELVDDTGRLGWAAMLEAFGELQSENADQTQSPLRFPGQYADRETGLHYNRFRYYDPQLGRFLSPDPISVEGGLNLYAYARNPIGRADPLGWKDGAKLEAAMVAGGEPSKPAGFAAHHVIPECLYNADKYPQYQGLLGDNPHTADNGIYLPSNQDAHDTQWHSPDPPTPPAQTIHKGGHAGYQCHVKKQLNDILELPPCQRQPALVQLRTDLKGDLQDGNFSRTTSKGKNVNGLNKHGNVKPPPPS